MPYSVREGINVFLAGFIPTEKIRFRDQEINFKGLNEFKGVSTQKIEKYTYPIMLKEQGNFTLKIQAGSFNTSQITILLGENGSGKTTFIKMIMQPGK